MEFLNYIKSEKYPCIAQTIFFSSSEIPVSFIYNFVQRLQQEKKYPVLFLDLSSLSIDQAKRDIAMLSFTGPVIYFIKNFYNLTTELKKKFKDFLLSYEGPNYLFVFDTKISKEPVVILEEKITLQNYYELFNYFYPNLTHNKSFISKLYTIQNEYTLHDACFLMNYELIIGQNTEYFFKHWFSKIVAQDKSLFRLSQYLFARDKQFFEEWTTLKSEYPIEFWLAFWSDQLFQSFTFLFYAKRGNLQQAQEIVKRLPFSFIKKDWRLYKCEFLLKAHEFLLSLDYGFKNGISELNLQLWYLKFIYAEF